MDKKIESGCSTVLHFLRSYLVNNQRPWGFLEGKRELVLPLTVADGRNVGLPVKDKVIQVLRRWQYRGKGAGIVLRHKESLLLKISNPVYAAGEKLCAWQSRKISPDATLCHFGQTLQETDGNGDYGFGQTMLGDENEI